MNDEGQTDRNRTINCLIWYKYLSIHMNPIFLVYIWVVNKKIKVKEIIKYDFINNTSQAISKFSCNSNSKDNLFLGGSISCGEGGIG